MAIFKRGRIYWFHFVFNGEHVQQSTKQGNPRVARQIEAAYKTKLAKGEVDIHDRRPVPMLGSAMAEFLEWSRREHPDHPRTHARYVTSSKALLRYFGNIRLDRITEQDVERFKSERSSQRHKRTLRPLRPATVNRELACAKAMFNYWAKSDQRLRNPFRNVKSLREDNEQMRVLTSLEEDRYLSCASQPLHDIAVLMLDTGMRPEEVYRIRIENVWLNEGKLYNPCGKTKAAKRKITLTSRAAAVLQKRIALAKGAYVFPHESDPEMPMLKVNNGHVGALQRSGVKRFRLYDLRHTFATRATESGMDLVTLAAVLGHSRLQMVMRYAHPTEQHQADAMKRLESFMAHKHIAAYEHAQATVPQAN